jgi:hypothetical protein
MAPGVAPLLALSLLVLWTSSGKTEGVAKMGVAVSGEMTRSQTAG